ncbi:MAG TPA: hypothetical protein VGW40_11670 [Allosphingosinicella sp.]|nr:hypothetical protein [Allosphingosinicella sp.]
MSLADQNPALDDFSGWVGQSFAVPVGGHRLMLTLEAAEELRGSARDAGGFRLQFLGPAELMLDQGIFPFEIEAERFELFIVPIGRDQRGTRYEAVFY